MNVMQYFNLSLFMVALTSGIGNALAGPVETKQAEIAARTAEAKGNAFASTQVYPAGTRFTITAIHSASPWYSDFYSTFYGKTATAADCVSGVSHGIEYETSESSRAGYYTACFYLDGDSFEYFVYGFKFDLVTTTTPPPASTSPSATFSNGTLTLKRMSLGGSYYDVVLKLVSQTSPLEFSVESAVPSQ